MTGFFKKEIPKNKKATSKSDCEACGLYTNCKSPYMEATGKGEKGILIIAECPGKEEDLQGKQLVGDSGKLLRKTLSLLEIDLDKDCRKINSVNCRPVNNKGENRTPTDKEISCCRSRVWKEIDEFKPKLIILLGGSALESFLNHRWRKKLGGINRWRGWQIPDRDVNAWVCPTFHPAYILWSGKNPLIERTFRQDLKKAVSCLDKPFRKYEKEESIIQLLQDPIDIVKELKRINDISPSEMAIDYETTAKKPHREGQDIITAALSWVEQEKEKCIAFPMNDEEVRKSFVLYILQNKKIGKIAHGISFEEQWSRVILKSSVSFWIWCTRLAAHVIDHREGVTWLKFLVYAYFGIVDYDSEIEPFIGSVEEEEDIKSANAFNQIRKIPIKKLLYYNGMDSLETRRLYEIQKKEMICHEGNNFLREGEMALVELESEGLCTDLLVLEKQKERINYKIKFIEESMEEDDDIQYWRSTYKENFNMRSPIQIKHILFEYLKIKPIAFTKKGNTRVNAETLEEYEEEAPFIKNLVYIRKLTKARDTNLKGIAREVVNGRMHPMYGLHGVESMRSNSSSPNAQNFPKRNPELEQIVRSVIVPSKGRQLLEVDYKAIEVKISACYNKDPMLISYVKDTSKDMHRDMAMELFLLSKDQVSKDLRYISKNGFVFPEFYGSYWKSVAPAVWKTLRRSNPLLKDSEITIMQHLKGEGIKQYEDFEKHLQKVEGAFWNKRFKVYRDWKEDTIETYYRKGYMDTYTGFRIKGPLDRTQIINLPIQGSSFHCLLWSLIQLCRIAKEENWQSKWVGQIHDSCINDLLSTEKEHVIDVTRRVMTQDILKHWKWITVPLEVEMEITPIDKAWLYKKVIEE